MKDDFAGSCPVQIAGDDRITLAHGEGGRLMRQLIRQNILPRFSNPLLAALGDAAILPPCRERLTMSTDSYVVAPLVFPGGDIGSLAVFGTVNDLVASGATPRWISLALIIEEGFPLAELSRILVSAAAAAVRVGVQVVTGDTKVVPQGAADRLFINTTGIGELIEPSPPGPSQLQVGDQLLVTGPIGRHGIAVLASREGLEFDPCPESDSGPLVDSISALRAASVPIRAMRDATRGGVAAVLHEWAETSRLTMSIDESNLPVAAGVRPACELLGLDPMHVANEGTMVIAVPGDWQEKAVRILQTVEASACAARIGQVTARGISPVVIHRLFGTAVPLDEPLGAPLPRIC